MQTSAPSDRAATQAPRHNWTGQMPEAALGVRNPTLVGSPPN